jgi:DNA-binding transcriptional MerR regulator
MIAAVEKGEVMARKKAKKAVARKAAGRSVSKAKSVKLYTLTQIGKMASVSMPTLQKYKRMYQDRIPSVGEGRKQRYPREAVAVLRQLKKENLAKRGRPPKSAAPAKRPATKRRAAPKKAAAKGKSVELLTLTEISRRTGISYPTVSRYVQLFLDRIPAVGAGRLRRFPEEAVAVFRQLRSESRPGRPPKSGAKKPARTTTDASNQALADQLSKLEMAQADLAKQVSSIVKLLNKPLQVTIKRL